MPATLPAPCDRTIATATRAVETPHPRWTLTATILASSLAFIDGSVVTGYRPGSNGVDALLVADKSVREVRRETIEERVR